MNVKIESLRKLIQIDMSSMSFRIMCSLILDGIEKHSIITDRKILSSKIKASSSTVSRSLNELQNIGIINSKNHQGRGLKITLNRIDRE